MHVRGETQHAHVPPRPGPNQHRQPPPPRRVIFFFTFATALSVGTGGLDAGKKAGSVLKTKIWSTMLGCWRVWPVANLINFAFVPANLRVLFMNVIGLGWNIYLSTAVN